MCAENCWLPPCVYWASNSKCVYTHLQVQIQFSRYEWQTKNCHFNKRKHFSTLFLLFNPSLQCVDNSRWFSVHYPANRCEAQGATFVWFLHLCRSSVFTSFLNWVYPRALCNISICLILAPVLVLSPGSSPVPSLWTRYPVLSQSVKPPWLQKS